MTRPDELLEEYHDETAPDRAPLGSWIAWGFLIAVAVFVAVALWRAWGAQ